MLLYIDPGTGSMLFTILIGLFGAGLYSARLLIMKIRFLMSGGKKEKNNKDRYPFVIFSDSKRYWNVFEPVCRIFNDNGIDIVYMTASPDDPCLNCEYDHVRGEFIGEGNKAFAKLNFLKADIVLSTTPGLDVYQWKRSKEVKYYIHIGHGVGDVSGYRMFGLDYYDSVMLTASYQVEEIRMLEHMRDLPEKDLPLIGITYMDEMKNRLMNSGSESDHQTTVLLAPSWGKSSILSRYGAGFIRCLLDTGYNIIIRPHPQSMTSDRDIVQPLINEFSDNKQITWNFDNDNFDVLKKSDIMISDFSGVIFDFSLVFDKPVIYADTSYDRSPYDSYWLKDRPMWIFESLPKIGRPLEQRDFPNMKSVIENTINDESLREGRDEVRRDGWQNIGYSAQAAYDYIQKKYKELNAE